MAKATKPPKPNNPWMNDWIEKPIHFFKWCYKHFPLRLIEVIGVVAAAYYAYQAVKVSSNSLTLSQQSNEANNAASERATEINQRLVNAADSSYKAAFEQLKYAKATSDAQLKIADAQIKSLNEQKKQFELTTTPRLQVEIDENYEDKIDDYPATLKYKIKNLGNNAVQIETEQVSFSVRGRDDTICHNNIGAEPLEILINQETPSKKIKSQLAFIKDGTRDSLVLTELKEGHTALHFCGIYIYKNLLTNEYYRYEFLIDCRDYGNKIFYNRNIPLGKNFKFKKNRYY